VNKIFLSGKIGKVPEVAYTPKGRKIVMFPMVVEEGGFSIDVVGAGESFPAQPDGAVGGSILVVGEIVNAKLKSRDVLRVNASKILRMEE
jgi:hypothetical protein